MFRDALTMEDQTSSISKIAFAKVCRENEVIPFLPVMSQFINAEKARRTRVQLKLQDEGKEALQDISWNGLPAISQIIVYKNEEGEEIDPQTETKEIEAENAMGKLKAYANKLTNSVEENKTEKKKQRGSKKEGLLNNSTLTKNKDNANPEKMGRRLSNTTIKPSSGSQKRDVSSIEDKSISDTKSKKEENNSRNTVRLEEGIIF